MAPSHCFSMTGRTEWKSHKATGNNQGVLQGQLRISRFLIRWQLAWSYRIFIQRGEDLVTVWEQKKKWGKNWATFCPPSHRHDTRVPLKWRQSFLEGNSLASTPHSCLIAPNMCMETDADTRWWECRRAQYSDTACGNLSYVCQFWTFGLAQDDSPGLRACKAISRAHCATCDVH